MVTTVLEFIEWVGSMIKGIPKHNYSSQFHQASNC